MKFNLSKNVYIYKELYKELNSFIHNEFPLDLPITYQLTYYLTLMSDIEANLGLTLVRSFEIRAECGMRLRDIFVSNRNMFLEYISYETYDYIKYLIEKLLCKSLILVMIAIDCENHGYDKNMTNEDKYISEKNDNNRNENDKNEKSKNMNDHKSKGYTEFVEKLYRLPSNSYNVWIISWLVSCINEEELLNRYKLRNVNWANTMCRNNQFGSLIPSIRYIANSLFN